jgi:hypothetical protein
MTDNQTPPDWVLIEAAKRGGFNPDLRSLRSMYVGDGLWKATFRALCDMIHRYEKPPAIDPLVQALTDCGWLGNPEYDADVIRDALAKRNHAIMEISEQDKAEPVSEPSGNSGKLPPAMSRDYRAGIEFTMQYIWDQGLVVSSWAWHKAYRDLIGGAGDDR